MHDTRLGAFAAPYFARYQPHAARAAVAGAAVMGQVDAVAQRSVQQQLAAARQKALPIDRNLVTSCHGLIPEGFKLPMYGGADGTPSLRFPDAQTPNFLDMKRSPP